ncbi:MAG: ATP-binding protein [Lachnospiraceae bacterium]|nr:ATP-binding protein [Lachnospiraceae bacterium]
MIKKGKQLNRIFRMLLLTLIFTAAFPITAMAAELSSGSQSQVVRVGYFDLGSYYTVLEDGTVDSYDTAFLNEISRNTGLTFTYVNCGTWQQATAMLEAHEIDLLGNMQWTEAREDDYQICDASYGYIVAELAALQDSDYIYEDYEKLNHARVGCIEGYVISDQLKKLMKQKQLSFTVTYYQNQAALDEALEEGEIDLVAANAHAMHEDWKIIEKFAYAPFYFASWKGNSALIEQISEAIIEIYIHNPTFDDNLVKKYVPQAANSPYSKKEYDVINRGDNYTIYFDGTAAPLVWYEKESETMKGVLVKICQQLNELTGLNLEVKCRTEDSDLQEERAVSYRTLYYDTFDNAKVEAGVSNSILDQNFELYHRIGDDYESGGAYRIAVVKNRDGLKDYLNQNYANCTVIEYDTPKSCMDALSRGDTDLAFLNTNVAENLVMKKSLDQITAIPASGVVFGIALQFQGENAKILAEIINKGISLIDESVLNDTMMEYALNTSPDITVSYLINQHLGLTLILVIVLILIILACAVLFTYARVMRRQNNKVEQANQDRMDFFSRMSHDLRTPMNGILGMIELTRQSDNMEEIKSNMDKAKDSGEYMLSLINDTLDLQRLENERLKFHPQPVQICEFIEGVADMIRASASQKNITLTLDMAGVEKERYVNIDPIRVKQIFANILSNALKFTPEGGTIEVKLRQLGQDGNRAHLKFTVRDTGIGMSETFLKKNLYKPYSQEKNEVTAKYAGSGLGLAITKNLIQLMGGRIEVTSELGEGTQFTIYLDLTYVESETVAETKKQQSHKQTQILTELAGTRILICEDHPLNAEIARRLLDKVGCRTDIAENGQLGLIQFKSSAPGTYDAILMDIRMPVMDGLTAAKAIRSCNHPDAQKILIIAMTANAYDEDVKKSKEAGMNDHLAKPINPTKLYETVAKHLSEDR